AAALPSTVLAAEPGRPPALPPATPRPMDFVRDVQPILTQHCVRCHGAEKQRGGLRLDNAKSAFAGGNSGVVLKPGDPASLLRVAVAGLDPDLKMPPEGKPSLSTEQVAHLRAWIEQGAKWSSDTGSAATQTAKSSHWAFQPVGSPQPPAVRTAG